MKRTWLRDMRKSRTVTLKELGDALHYSESVMCNIENGRRKTRGLDTGTLAKIAEALDVEPNIVLRAEMDWLREAGVCKG